MNFRKRGTNMNSSKTARQIEKKLNDAEVYPDKFFKYKGEYVVRWYFYYTHGKTANAKATDVKVALPDAQITDYSENWNPWPNDSYFEVKFTI